MLRSGKRVMKFKISNIRVLSEEELRRWKVENLDLRVYDVSAVFSDSVDPEVIAHLIGLLECVVDVKIVDLYRGPQIPPDHFSLTLRVRVFDRECYEEILGVLRGIGASIR
jgi:prephenate dehydrogenase